MEAMLQRFNYLKDCIIAIPSSCYGDQKRYIINNNAVFTNANDRFEGAERL